MDVFKYSTEVSNIPRGGLNVFRRCQIFHGAVKYSTELLKYSTEVSNIPRRGLNIPRRGLTIPQRYEIFHTGA